MSGRRIDILAIGGLVLSHPAAAIAADGRAAEPVTGTDDFSGTGLSSLFAAAPPAGADATQRLNTTGRDIPLGGPLTDGGFILGEISYVLTADSQIVVDAKMLLPLLQRALTPELWQRLATAIGDRGEVSTRELADLGLSIAYDPSNFGLRLSIGPEMRPRQAISVSGGYDPVTGPVEPPQDFSAYLTAFANVDYVHKGGDTGLADPNVLLDSAVRLKGFVLENEASIQGRFRREGTRLVYDDLRRTARYTVGDLEPISRGFSGASPMAGASIVRVYADLEPQRNIQPRGQRSFTLTRASTVETIVNGQTVQQTRLNPGTYDITDFPFAQGANDVRLVIRDDTGRENVISFSINFDRTLLSAGLSEFGLFAGVEAPFSAGGRSYSGTPIASGFYRRGVSDELTVGGNFQANDKGGVAGAEVVWASPIGTLAFNLAGSKNKGIGSGYAVNIGYELAIRTADQGARSLTASFQTLSRDFATPGALIADNRFKYEFGATYSQTIGADHYVSTDAFYSVGRGSNPDQSTVRATYGWRASPRLLFTAEASYEDRRRESGFGIRLGLTYRFNRKSSGSAEIDTRRERGRLSYQRSSGTGVGSYNASASIDRFEDSTGVNANLNLTTNRAEVGAAHLTSFSNGGGIIDQRSSLRAGASIAFAGGQVALSRPIYDSFAIVKPHESLGKASVYLDPRGKEYLAKSGALGGAVMPELSAYSPRLVTYDAPAAPAGYDLGRGSVQFVPPYRSGHLVRIGSEYFVTYTGQLLAADETPRSLVAGLAYEEAAPDRPPIQMFTNRAGRFAVQGLRAGRWRIEVPTRGGDTAIYAIEVPAGADGLVRGGAIKPEGRK